MTMSIRFWGVRGSIASPGPDTARVGGNTSCVEVLCDDTRIILDAGTGLRKLGNAMMQSDDAQRTVLMLSHLHWDHIQGLPFFAPLYVPSTRLTIHGHQTSTSSLYAALAQQMTSPVFPVELGDLPASIDLLATRGGASFSVGGARVRVGRLNHPGGVLAYRIDHGSHSVVYATDTEHYACVDPVLQQLAKGADVLIYDAQYTPQEYVGEGGPPRVGWGHSTYEAAARAATEAGVAMLVLFHHDPGRSDEAVEQIEQRARARFPNTMAARESMVIVPGEIARAA